MKLYIQGETCNVNHLLSRYAREKGHEVRSVTVCDSPALRRDGQEYDINLHLESGSWVRKMLSVARAFGPIVCSDVLVFLNRGIFRGGYDVRALSTIGKLVVVIYTGCAARSVDMVCLFCPAAAGCGPGKMRSVRRVCRSASHVFARPNYAGYIEREYHPYWVPVDLDDYHYNVPMNSEPVVFHSSTNPAIKGYDVIKHAMQDLVDCGHKFRFVLARGDMPRAGFFEALSAADIVVDQVHSTGYGKFAIDGMASGCAVVGSGGVPSYRRWLGYPASLPIIPATDMNLGEVLAGLLDHRDTIEHHAIRGREYVEQYHDHRVVFRDFFEKVGIE